VCGRSSVTADARRLCVDLVECVGETTVGKDRLENSLENDVGEPAVQPLVLEHVEDEHHALTSRLRTYQMLQLLCVDHNNVHRSFHII